MRSFLLGCFQNSSRMLLNLLIECFQNPLGVLVHSLLYACRFFYERLPESFKDVPRFVLGCFQDSSCLLPDSFWDAYEYLIESIHNPLGMLPQFFRALSLWAPMQLLTISGILFGRLAFLDTINRIWPTGAIPDEWKGGLVIPILKEEKDKTLTTSYRPITILSCVGKIRERMVNRR